jgi:hypothetical protein
VPTATLVVLVLLVLSVLLRVAARDRLTRLSSLPPEEQAALDKAEKLWRSDPAAAHQALDEYYIKQGDREETERAKLREAAQSDPAAALELQRQLKQELEVWQALLKQSRKAAKKDPNAQKSVANVEQWDRETRAELQQLGDRLKQFKA